MPVQWWALLCHECFCSQSRPVALLQEMEIGITGGVEDGVDNSGAAKECF